MSVAPYSQNQISVKTSNSSLPSSESFVRETAITVIQGLINSPEHMPFCLSN